jgi:hypothetical protein
MFATRTDSGGATPHRLDPGSVDGPLAAGAAALLEGLHHLALGHTPGAHEGPGAMVDAGLWSGAVRRLADELLAPATDPDGTLRLPPLSTPAQAAADRLYGPGAVPPLPPDAGWDGRLLVVLGCGRSGTTWLETLLMAAPEAGGVDGAETFLFRQCSPLWDVLPRAEALCDATRLARALRRFCDTVLAATLQAHRPGARVFVEKTPKHVFVVPQIAAVYPEARFVHLLRDGRDVARSISQVPFFGLPDPADAALLWARVVRTVRRDAAALAHYREERYEQLHADPVGRTLELLSWAGVPTDDQLAEQVRQRAAVRVSTHAGTAQAVGRDTWATLPPADLHRVLAECGRLLVREGYLTRSELRRARTRPAYWRRRIAGARRDLAAPRRLR